MGRRTQTRRVPDAPSRSDAAASAIVVGLDGSPSSWDAFCWAAGQAARSKGRVVAVYVIPRPEPAAAFGAPYDYVSVERARQEIADELRTEATRRGDELGVPVCLVAEYGDATRVLTDVARELHANLVVVGKSAKRLHQVTGSLSHRLTRRNDAPVVVVVP